ncbi:MAG: DNA recombination protein RmuC [Candidatus Omnitrophica bacterium]|nr:DNA recombination protein RmuC [Candidatus Omnitrophota bacterium]
MLILDILILIVSLLILVLIYRTSMSLSSNDKGQFKEVFKDLEEDLSKLEKSLDDQAYRNREELSRNIQRFREEQIKNLNAFNEAILSRMTDVATLQKNQLDSFAKQLSQLTQMNEKKMDQLKETIHQQLSVIQKDNAQQLDKMRETVDEKLHATLEERLGQSFKIVSDRLEKVHQGLGEMQNLASGVGDLKKVLTNVKTRGTLGEIQLENLLEQILIPEQYERNIITKKNSRDPVEFAIRFPKNNLLMPIDAKFPKEDYERLQEAIEAGDLTAIQESEKALEQRFKQEAKKIREKYIDPPHTTDFALMFLPFEGLYAEVIRRPGFFELLQRDYKVIVAGPSTIAAMLNSFQMGFRTLAVEKRASEVWTLLGKVKTEFGKFGNILDQTHKKLQEASNTIEKAASKSRNIERKLIKVQELPTDSPDNKLLENGFSLDVSPQEDEIVPE